MQISRNEKVQGPRTVSPLWEADGTECEKRKRVRWGTSRKSPHLKSVSGDVILNRISKGPDSVSWSEDSEDQCSANFWLASQYCPWGRSVSGRNQNNMWVCAQVGVCTWGWVHGWVCAQMGVCTCGHMQRECVHRWLCTQVSVCRQTTHVNELCRFTLWHLLWGERKANTDSLG